MQEWLCRSSAQHPAGLTLCPTGFVALGTDSSSDPLYIADNPCVQGNVQLLAPSQIRVTAAPPPRHRRASGRGRIPRRTNGSPGTARGDGEAVPVTEQEVPSAPQPPAHLSASPAGWLVSLNVRGRGGGAMTAGMSHGKSPRAQSEPPRTVHACPDACGSP